MVPSVQDDKESRPPCGSLQLGEDEARKIHCCPFGKQSRDLRIEWEGTEMSALWVQLSPLVCDHLEETLDIAFCIGKLLEWTLISRCRTLGVAGWSSWESLSVMVATLLAETKGVGLLLFYRGS